ncbi:hypothetical protein [Streptomyces sp. DASNCL29]|uniref:hypothetical protein n=1 Tax=Streptomyces sp. DASNCL29 TaxID=2583819 RepID=UPI0019D1290F|nr:hypothetical protein [Streptomyces sp. DASNCL29]
MFTRAPQQLQAQADTAGDIDWLVQIDSTIVRALCMPITSPCRSCGMLVFLRRSTTRTH